MVTRLDARRIASVALLIVVLAIILFPSYAMGIVTLKITDSEATPDQTLHVKYANIALHRTGEGERYGWVELLTNATGIYDLSTLRGTSETVLRSRLPVGKYDKIRLTVVEATTSVNKTKINLSIKQAALTLNIELNTDLGEERILLIDFKSNSTRARIDRVYEGSPVVTIMKTSK